MLACRQQIRVRLTAATDGHVLVPDADKICAAEFQSAVLIERMLKWQGSHQG